MTMHPIVAQHVAAAIHDDRIARAAERRRARRRRRQPDTPAGIVVRRATVPSPGAVRPAA